MPGRLAGKVAIVTGAASCAPGVGNGKAIAIQFAREGATVVAVNRSPARAQGLCDEIAAEGGRCFAYGADVTNGEQVNAMVADAVTRYGAVHILVNNVGAGGPGTIANVTQEVWSRALESNLTSTMLCCQSVIPHMAAAGGSIINIGSLAGVQGFRRGDIGFTAYSAAKAALIGLTRGAAADVAAQGIRVNCLLVGMVHTPRLEPFGEAARERRRLAVPLQTEGTAWDVAWAAVYLASDEARWVTGVMLPIDGGQLAIRDWPA